MSERPTSEQNAGVSDLGRADSDVSDTTVADAGDVQPGSTDDNVSSADYPAEDTSDPWQSENARRPTQTGGDDV